MSQRPQHPHNYHRHSSSSHHHQQQHSQQYPQHQHHVQQPSSQYRGHPEPEPEIHPDDLRYITQTQRSLAQGGSPASSRSSNASQSALSLDPNALARLSGHFDAVLEGITERVEQLSMQTLRSTQGHHRRAEQVAARADEEMERLREILRQCDELQDEFLKIKRIGEIVKGFRRRVESLEGRVGR